MLCYVITGPPKGQVLFCSLVSVVVSRRLLSSSVTLSAGVRQATGAWAVGRPTLHGGPVQLRHVRATPCLNKTESVSLVLAPDRRSDCECCKMCTFLCSTSRRLEQLERRNYVTIKLCIQRSAHREYMHTDE